MAHVYVRSGAAGANNGSSKTDAYTTLGAAFTAKAAGDNFWVASDHAETQASAMTLTSPGTLVAPCTAICVDFAGSTPPVSADLRTTATITTTGNSALNFDKTCAYYGITFNCGTGAVAAGMRIGSATDGQHFQFRSCVLKKLGTVGTNQALIFSGFSYCVFDNTRVDFGATDDTIWLAGVRFVWRNTAAPIVTTYPTTLFGVNQIAGDVLLEGVDLSNAGFSGGTLIGANTYSGGGTFLVKNCKVHASLALYTTPTSLSQTPVVVIKSDSAGTNYRHEKHDYCGDQTVETTIVRTGGATDGTTPIAWKIVTTANTEWLFPFELLPIAVPNDTTGANVTVTIYGIWGEGWQPTTADIWPVISYMGSSGSPIATIVSGGTADYLAAGTDWPTDTSSWGGSTTKFKMAVTLSSPQPALKGPIYVTLKAAANMGTFYIDPKPVLT